MIFIFSGTVFSSEYGKRYIPCTIKNEKCLRNELYRSYSADVDFYKKCSCHFNFFNDKNTVCSCEFFKNMDFFITILETHIQKLQKKIIKPNVFFRSKSVGIGCGCLGLSGFVGVLSYLFLTRCSWPKKEEYIERISDYTQRYHVSKHSDAECSYMACAVGLPIFSCWWVKTAFSWFRKFYTSAERQPGRLRRDEVLLAILKEKRRMRDRGFGY